MPHASVKRIGYEGPVQLAAFPGNKRVSTAQLPTPSATIQPAALPTLAASSFAVRQADESVNDRPIARRRGRS
jgi:hypothetical protein